MCSKLLTFPMITSVSIVCYLAEGTLDLPLQVKDNVLDRKTEVIPFCKRAL